MVMNAQGDNFGGSMKQYVTDKPFGLPASQPHRLPASLPPGLLAHKTINKQSGSLQIKAHNPKKATQQPNL